MTAAPAAAGSRTGSPTETTLPCRPSSASQASRSPPGLTRGRSGIGAVPPERARLAEGSDVLEPALEQLGHRDRPPNGAVLDLDHEAGKLGLGLSLTALEEAPDLDGLALPVAAQVDPQLPRSWATLSHGAFACDLPFPPSPAGDAHATPFVGKG